MNPEFGFEIDVSGQVRDFVSQQGVVLSPNPEGLYSLAKAIKVDLPEHPRVLLLNTGQLPNSDEFLILNDGYLPRCREGDLVVNLEEPDALSEVVLARSVALALAKRKRERQNTRLFRSGVGLLALSGGSFASGEALDVPVANMVSTASILGGVGLLTYVVARGAPKIPDISRQEPPIRLIGDPRL